MTTLGACGDVERNVMACPAPHRHDGVHEELQAAAARLAAHLAPRTRAYHEIWLNGEAVNGRNGESSNGAEAEPMYGKVYLPRKFKTGLATPEDNCIDVYAQDLGLLAIVEDGRVAGYNVLVGGGMGITHGNDNTFPFLAKPICYVPATDVVHAAESVVKLFRDHGNRADRRRARIKYVVHDWGVERFREVLAGYLGRTPDLPRPVEVSGFDLHLGWHPQGDGKWYYGLSVENGRVKDEGALRLRSGLRAIVERFRPELRLTPMQDVLLCDLDGAALPILEKMLDEYGVPRPEHRSNVRKLSMACPAHPDVRPRPVGGRAVDAGHPRRTGNRDGEARSGTREPERPHDRLSQRLREALPERNRHRRPQRRQVRPLRRRPRPGPPPQFRVEGSGAAP